MARKKVRCFFEPWVARKAPGRPKPFGGERPEPSTPRSSTTSWTAGSGRRSSASGSSGARRWPSPPSW